MKILILDIETAPNTAYVWGLWNQNVSIGQIRESGYILSWAAKWVGKKTIHHRTKNDSDFFIEIHRLLNKADAVVHFNGTKFDMPWLNTAFIRSRMAPPAPYHQVDLLKAVRLQFKFPSNKLAYVAPALEIGDKVDHMEFRDWIGCMEGDKRSWRKMVKYNIEDVKLTELLYYKLLPWIKQHPNHAMYKDDKRVCPNCGSNDIHYRGSATTRVAVYYRFQCQNCGTWSRGMKNQATKKEIVGVTY